MNDAEASGLAPEAHDPRIAHAQARVGKIVRQKWRLDALLGMGGMAAVYAATHRNGHRVAVKMLHPWLVSMGDARSRFFREAYVANAIDHPAIVPVLDDDEAEDGSPFLVMELLRGESLEDRIVRLGALAPSEALVVTSDLLDALDAAHQRSVLHRDIKPDNVFLERQVAGRTPVRLLDFGIARLREITPSHSHTQQGYLLGTPAYMAPEQALGRWDVVDARTDLWAVGATLFAMLAGVPPRDGEDLVVLVAAAHEPVPDVRSRAPHVPAPLAELIKKATAPEMEGRFASAALMREAVDRCRDELHLTSKAISLEKLVGTLPPESGSEAIGPVGTQEFERDDLALSAEMPLELDDDATRFEPFSPEALAALRPRSRSGASKRPGPPGDDDPTTFLERGPEVEALGKTAPDGVPTALVQDLLREDARRKSHEESRRQAAAAEPPTPKAPTEKARAASPSPEPQAPLALPMSPALTAPVLLALAGSALFFAAALAYWLGTR